MLSNDSITIKRSPGRPVTIDPEAVAALALRIFAERGYEQTSMEDIAREAHVGRKTLYRHFANKADLVWGGMGPVIEASAAAFDSAPAEPLPANAILDGLREAVLAGIAAIPDLAVTRGRLRLIAEHPELLSRSQEYLGTRHEQTRSYLTARGIPEDTARYLCAALSGALFEAWLQWAAHDDSDPAPYLRRALAVLRLG
ncbi:TetR family transcriptional regulator [Paenarthrobacter nitroguajacolicus]|uniref:TetR/AcrR family transcriptional regulator n=1 Tax=Paenarthrobacter nitroguajacolicus TaxID=211146 RepID=UPI0028578EC8|nr:TetR family transcriptional regulator [Paenarthrobacter nitroguajacolicus]MDR6639552.1 AcrR family transcriptional regulator [Paenarthrobacter nitroguajacolicus]